MFITNLNSNRSNLIDEMIGDINSDGSVNILDVVILANAILTGDDLPAGDINDDGCFLG